MLARPSRVRLRLLSLALAIALLVPLQPPSAAQAQVASTLIFAVTTSNTLVRFDRDAPGTILSSTAISGLQGGEGIVGIDFRPVSGQLFALGSLSRLYVINPSNGVATQIGTGTFGPTLSGTSFGFDFNPVPDAIRIFSNGEQNLRVSPNTGAVTDFDPATVGTQPDPSINPAGNLVAAAYDNNVAGATTTTLYGIDSGSDQLVRIGGPSGNPSPNLGAVTNIGPLGVDTSDLVGFDVAEDDNSAFASLTATGAASSQLYRINLGTGRATLVGTIGGGLAIRALAVGALLGVTGTDTPDPIAVGGTLTLSGTVMNYGITNLTDVRLIFKFPASVTPIGNLPPNCAFEAASQRGRPLSRVMCQLNEIAPAASASSSISVRPGSAGQIGGLTRAKATPFSPDNARLFSRGMPRTTTVNP